jgi:hypothetical protein
MRLTWESLLSASLICASIGVKGSAPLRAQSAPCQQIRTACKSAGFVQGGAIGERLVLDCFNPIVLGERPKRPPSRELPRIDQRLAAACRDSLNKQPDSAGSQPQLPVADASTLTASQDGRTVHDTRLAVTWLADANLAATQSFGVANINKSGSMDYATAMRWVAAMNAFNHGAGYLGHNHWQLPTAPSTDRTCQLTGPHGEPFGYNCSGSALGSLYYVSLALREPDAAVTNSENHVGPFLNFQPYLYWSKSPALDPKQGFVSFSFNSGFQGANVFRNYLYVLPMFKGKLPGTPSTADEHLQADASGATVYDPIAQITWLANANLAARQTFGIAGIDRDGSMDHNTALLWVKAMNESDGGHGYLGRTDWDLPDTGPPDPTCSMKGITGFGCTGSAMGALFYRQLGLHPGDSVIPPSEAKVGPFYNVQPYLYWACAGDTAASPCQPSGPADGFEWNFSFGNGFQGTNLVGNHLFVMVYYPDAPAGQPAPKP